MRVLVFGASTAQGFWDSRGGWVDRLKDYYDELQMRDFTTEQPQVMNLGVSGDSSQDVLERIGPEAGARKNEKGIAIIVQVGSNNAAVVNGRTRSTTEKYQEQLAKIIDESKKLTDKFLLVGLPAVDEAKTNPIAWVDWYFKNDNIERFEAAAKSAAERAGVTFVPIFEHFEQGMIAQDGLHPNDAGHQLIFELVQPHLNQLLKTSESAQARV